MVPKSENLGSGPWTIWHILVLMKSFTDLVVFKQLQEEGGHCGGDSDEEVDDDEEHVGCAGHFKPEGRRVHDRSDGPPGRETLTHC